MENRKPIGYWVRQLDELLTKGIDNIHADAGLTRSDWQVLNLINEKGSVDSKELAKLMSSFENESVVEAILAKFSADVLIETIEDGQLRLTAKGSQLYADCLGKQKIFRQRVMQDISEQDYLTTVATLGQMTKNITP